MGVWGVCNGIHPKCWKRHSTSLLASTSPHPPNRATEQSLQSYSVSFGNRRKDMKLLTHNMLHCHIKGVTNGYPFLIQATKVGTKSTDFNPDFLRNMFGRLEWGAFVQGARSLGVEDLPNEVEESVLENEDFLKKFHHALLEVDLEEGVLVCPETGREFTVSRGIPNLLLKEDEC